MICCQQQLVRIHRGEVKSHFVDRYKRLFKKPGGSSALGLTDLGPIATPDVEVSLVRPMLDNIFCLHYLENWYAKYN